VSKIIRIAVSVILLAVIGWRMDWGDVADKFAHLRVDLWLGSVLVLILAQVISARRWQLFARELRFERSLAQYCAYYLIGMYFNLSLPTSVGGDVVRVWYLNGKSGRKWAALASVFLERLNGLLVLVAMACLGVLITPVELPWWIAVSVWSLAGIAVLGMVTMPIARRWTFLPAHRQQQLHAFVDLAQVPRLIASATGLSIIVQGLGVLSLWLIGMSLGLDIPAAYYCVLGPMVSLLTLLPISFNGMGLRELGTIVFLAPIGHDANTATTLAFLWFAGGAAVSLLGGLVYLFGAYPKADLDSNPQTERSPQHGPLDCHTDQGREGELTKAA
jgi:glycosyltransferase 2 family protein